MANEEHVTILKQGAKVWNVWREEKPGIVPDLLKLDIYETDLDGIDFSGIDLTGANLNGAILEFAQLNRANLEEANLEEANLSGADLIEANLSRANLFQVDFSGANLRGANLRGADLKEAIFSEVNLSGTDWTQARCIFTVLGNVDLSHLKGLETVVHDGPSTIGIDTIYHSGGNIPEVFLRGAGVPDNFITFMKSLTGSVFDFYSCFISHSSKDREFVERLYADLQSNGVRCWYAPHHMEIGAPILNEIDKAIRVHDKLLLILSEYSVGSRWVEHEVLSATSKEFQQERDKRTLFPIRLDDAVMDTNVQWARTLKDTRHIADFTGWKDHDSYKKAFDKLLSDLKGKS